MSTLFSTLTYAPDVALPGFEAATLTFPDDYDGPVVATLARRRADAPTPQAVLYIHGYSDYFFQAHLAEAYNRQGFDFYALDLRKYGRSLLPGQHPNFCQDIREYDAEITAAIDIIEREAHTFLLLNGHSTGGLIAALYADRGARRDRINAIFLNSPFFAFNAPPSQKASLPLLALAGRAMPFRTVSGGVNSLYPKSIHKDYYGEWDFNTAWKPIDGFPTYYGWIRAIHRAQGAVRARLSIQRPVLVMHSDRSARGAHWRELFRATDIVLNIEDMKQGARRLGRHVAVVEIPGAVHDLVLSRRPVRDQVFAALFEWIDTFV